MQLAKNHFKQKLTARQQTLYGLWLGLVDNVAAEIIAGAGFDWLLIDDEHAPFDIRSIQTHLQVLAAMPVSPIIRPRNHDAAHLKKLLDIGAQNFLMPMVNTPEQATTIIDSLLYPPQGSRGLGTSLARAAGWNRITDYISRANDEICLIVQAETMTALENLEALLAIERVDGVFIGPSDLAASMGKPGQPENEAVVAAVSKALQMITAADKPAGVLAASPERVSQYQKLGASFIGLGTDTSLLAQASRQLAEKYKKHA